MAKKRSSAQACSPRHECESESMSTPSGNESEVPTERETKLTPPAGFELSGLEQMLPDATIRTIPSLDLLATYFDTKDLTLARAGITVRHRTGDGPPTWTLKLPAGNRSNLMVRRELDIEGERNRRPPELRAIVAVHLRGQRLVPVATLHTSRDRVMVMDEHDHELVEIARDAVTATRRHGEHSSWDEIEIEAKDAIIGDEVRGEVARALRAGGCKKAAAVPKLIRALGDDASAAPDVAVPDLPRHPSATDAVRHALARSVAQMLAHDPGVRLGGDPEDLHQLRVGIRRLRSDLRTFRDFFDSDTVERIRDELRWVADETNQLRDLDVLCQWLQQRSSVVPVIDQHATGELIERGNDHADTCRVAVLRALGSRRYRRLIDDVVQLLATTPNLDTRAKRSERKHLARQLHQRWKRLDAKMSALGDDPTDADLHRARIAAKKCRAVAEAAEPLAGRDMHRFARSLAQLQDVLGAVRDASVIESWLRQAGGTPAAFAAGELALVARLEGQAQEALWPRAWARVKQRHRAI